MIAQELEKKMIDAISAAIGEVPFCFQIFGAWQPATMGIVKNAEDPSAVATISVVVGTAARKTFSSGDVGYSGAVALRVRADGDPDGRALLALAAPIEELFKTWQGETYQQSFAALSVSGFDAGDITVDGGNPPVIDFKTSTVTVDWSFTISGSDAA